MPKRLSYASKSNIPSLGSSSPKGGLSIARQTIICAVLSLVLMTVSARFPDLFIFTGAKALFQVVALPVRVVGSAISAPFQAITNVAGNLTADDASLSDLKAENAKLRARNAELEEAEKTASRLQSLLKLQDTYKLESTAARIVSGSTDTFSSTVMIDKGSSDGLAVGMPVTDSNGAIGQIIEVATHSATVKLITDASSGVSAMIQSSRAQGVLTGSATGDVKLTLIRTTQKVSVGDVVITSGMGGVFPKGLPLGTVSSVESAPGALYYTISVTPYVQAENNEEVLVITSLREEQKASAEDIAQADAQETGSTTQEDDKSDSSDSDNSSASTANQQ